MKKKVNLIETIDEARANRVSPEKFEQTWGYNLEHHVERMMDFINELERQGTPAGEQKCNHTADKAQQPTADHERILPKTRQIKKDRRKQ